MTEIEKYFSEFERLGVIKAVFSLPTDGCPYKKTVIRQLEGGSYQAESFTDKQAFHENFEREALGEKMAALFGGMYRQAQVTDEKYVYGAKLSKKGKLLTNRTKRDVSAEKDVPESHNRQKKYIITAENLPPVFEELGIRSENGKILSAKYDKYRQICRFTELIDRVLSKDSWEALHIMDFGCGKSYLTFVIYFYVTEILHKKVHITGLDLKSDVVERCSALAKKYGYSGLEFLCMDIKDFEPKRAVDMVISLHACDTATDYALYFAVKCGAKYIFSVPCCQKEANAVVKTEKFSLLTDYGLIKERFCALATDALRAKLLELCGYSANISEFIDFENSPKNVLIRATRRAPSFGRHASKRILNQIDALKSEFNISITLERLLKDNDDLPKLI